MRPAPSAIIIALAVMAGACRPCATGPVTRELSLRFSAEASTPQFTLEYVRASLDGELNTIVVPVPSGVPVTLSLWIGAGSDHEGTGEAGASHLSRHVLGNAAEQAGTMTPLLDSGGTFRAWTSRRFTVVTVTALPGELDRAIAVLGPWLRPAGTDDEQVLAAREAVEAEADEWWTDPRATGLDALHSLVLGPERTSSLYPDMGSLEQTGSGSVASFLERNFRSGKMVLAAAIPRSKMARLSSLPAPRKGNGQGGPGPAQPQPPFTRVLTPLRSGAGEGSTGADRSLVLAGAALPSLGSKRGAAAHMLALWLGGRGPGTVHEFLTEMTGALETVETSLDTTAGGNLLSITSTAGPGSEAEAVRAVATALALTTVIAPSGPALEQAARDETISWMMELSDPGQAAAWLARHEHVSSGIPIEDHLPALFEVVVDQVDDVTAGFLEPGGVGYVVVRSPPGGHDLPVDIDPATLDALALAAVSEILEEAGRAREACFPESGVAGATSKDGVRVTAVTTPGTGSVAITGLVGAGSLHESPGREGTAKLLSLLMTGKLAKAVALSPGLDPRYVTSSAIYQPDRIGVHLVVPEDRWQEGILAVRSALMRPSLGTKAFERARQECISRVGMQADPAVQGMRAALGALLGLGGGYNPDGTVASLGTLTPGEVREFHHASLARATVVAVAGSVEAAGACTIAAVACQPLFAGEDGGTLPLVTPGPAAQAPGWHPAVSEGSGPVAWITAVWAAPGIESEDHLPVQVIAHMLDGAGGLLGRTLITAKGLAAGIEADTWATSGWGILVVRIQAPATNVDAVLGELETAFAHLASEPPPRKEIEAAAARIRAERMQAMAQPATAARLLALETLQGGSPAGGMDETLSGMTRLRIAEVVETWFAAAAPAISVLAP